MNLIEIHLLIVVLNRKVRKVLATGSRIHVMQLLIVFCFSGDEYYRFSEQFNSDDYTIDLEYPKKISSNWIGLPNSIDAVFQWGNGETYFFKGIVFFMLV